MPNYRRIANGFITADISEEEANNLFRNLDLLRKDAYSDFELVVKGHVTLETLRIASRLTGGSFRQFMEANYNQGSGSLANLIKDIAHFLNGRLGHHSIITSIKNEEQKLQNFSRSKTATYTPSKRAASALPLLEDGYIVHDHDLYRLMAGISPANVGRFLQLLGGENYYV